MQKFIYQVGFAFVMLMLALPGIVLANAVFNIVPDRLLLSLSTSGTRTINYTVTNDTSQNISKIGIEPAYLTTGNADGISLDTDNCSDITLAPNSNCTFRVLLEGDEQTSNFVVRPRVCGYDGLVCSVPLAANEVQVTLSTPPAVTNVYPASAGISDTIPQILLNFNVPMSPSSLNNSTVTVTQNGSTTNLISSCTASNNNETFSCPFNTAPLIPNRTYTINVSHRATTSSGEELQDDYTSTFTVAALIAGDGATYHNTYYVNGANAVSQTATATNFTASTITGGPFTGTIIQLAGDGIGHMYFATTTGQVWQNLTPGGAFTLSTRTGTLTGSIVALGGDGDLADNMYYATSTGQVWFNTSSARTNFTQATLTGGTLTGTITQIAADNQNYACLLTTTSQVWCGSGGTFTPITFSSGSLSGNIVQLTGLNDGGTPLNISFYTSNNQIWQQTACGTNNFQLAT